MFKIPAEREALLLTRIYCDLIDVGVFLLFTYVIFI